MADPVAYDAGEPATVKRRKISAKRMRQQAEHNMRGVLQTYSGRAVLWELLELCGVFSSSYRGDVHAMVYQEGQRKIGLTVIENINRVDPNAYVQMQREAATRELEQES